MTLMPSQQPHSSKTSPFTKLWWSLGLVAENNNLKKLVKKPSDPWYLPHGKKQDSQSSWRRSRKPTGMNTLRMSGKKTYGKCINIYSHVPNLCYSPTNKIPNSQSNNTKNWLLCKTLIKPPAPTHTQHTLKKKLHIHQQDLLTRQADQQGDQKTLMIQGARTKWNMQCGFCKLLWRTCPAHGSYL